MDYAKDGVYTGRRDKTVVGLKSTVHPSYIAGGSKIVSRGPVILASKAQVVRQGVKSLASGGVTSSVNNFSGDNAKVSTTIQEAKGQALFSYLLSSSKEVRSNIQNHLERSVLENPEMIDAAKAMVNTRLEHVRNAAYDNPVVVVPEAVDTSFENLLRENFRSYTLRFTQKRSMGHAKSAALRRIMRRYCRDLLGYKPNVSTPDGFDMGLKDVGAGFFDVANENLVDVHMCTPELDFRDHQRHQKIMDWIESHVCVQSANHKVLCHGLRTGDVRFRCESKSQVCHVTAPRLLLMHSAYDMSVEAIVDSMISARASKAIMTLHYDQLMCTGSKSGEIPTLDLVWHIERRDGINYYVQRFKDSQAYYRHRLDVYLSKFFTKVVLGSDGYPYLFELKEVILGVAIVEIVRRDQNFLHGGILTFPLPNSIPKDTLVIHTWDYVIGFRQGSFRDWKNLVPVTLSVPKMLFEQLYRYGETVESNKFTIFAMTKCCVALMSRRNIGGTLMVDASVSLSWDKQLCFVAAVYMILFEKRFGQTQTVTEVRKDIENYRFGVKRNPFYRIFSNILSGKPSGIHPFCNEDIDKIYSDWSKRDDSSPYSGLLTSAEYKFVEDCDEHIMQSFMSAVRKAAMLHRRSPIIVVDSDDYNSYTMNIPDMVISQVPVIRDEVFMAGLSESIGDTFPLPITILPGKHCDSALRRVAVPYDGNCLYSAILAAKPYGNCSIDNLKARLRTSLFYGDVYKSIPDDDDRASFVDSLNNNGSWGDKYVLVLAALTLGIRYCVHVYNCDGRFINTITYGSSSFSLVHLSYDGCHYDFMEPKVSLSDCSTTIADGDYVVSLVSDFGSHIDLLNDCDPSTSSQLIDMCAAMCGELVDFDKYTKEAFEEFVLSYDTPHAPYTLRSVSMGFYRSIAEAAKAELLFRLRGDNEFFKLDKVVILDPSPADFSRAVRNLRRSSDIIVVRQPNVRLATNHIKVGVHSIDLDVPYIRASVPAIISAVHTTVRSSQCNFIYADLYCCVPRFPYVRGSNFCRTEKVERENKIVISWGCLSGNGCAVFRIGDPGVMRAELDLIGSLFSKVVLIKPVIDEPVSMDAFLLCFNKRADIDNKVSISEATCRFFYKYMTDIYFRGPTVEDDMEDLYKFVRSTTMQGGGGVLSTTKCKVKLDGNRVLSSLVTGIGRLSSVFGGLKPAVVQADTVVFKRNLRNFNVLWSSKDYILDDCLACTSSVCRLAGYVGSSVVFHDPRYLVIVSGSCSRGFSLDDFVAGDYSGEFKNFCLDLNYSCNDYVSAGYDVSRFLRSVPEDTCNLKIVGSVVLNEKLLSTILLLTWVSSRSEVKIYRTSNHVSLCVTFYDVHKGFNSRFPVVRRGEVFDSNTKPVDMSFVNSLLGSMSYDVTEVSTVPLHKLSNSELTKMKRSYRVGGFSTKPEVPVFTGECIGTVANILSYKERDALMSDVADALADEVAPSSPRHIEAEADLTPFKEHPTDVDRRYLAILEFKRYSERSIQHDDHRLTEATKRIKSFCARGRVVEDWLNMSFALNDSPIRASMTVDDQVGYIDASGKILKNSEPIVSIDEISYVYDIVTGSLMEYSVFKNTRSYVGVSKVCYYALFTSVCAHNQTSSVLASVNDVLRNDINKLKMSLDDLKVSFLQAVPGAGKTYWLVNSCCKKDDIVVTPTSENRESFKSKITAVYPKVSWENRVKTINGFLVDYDKKMYPGGVKLVSSNTRMLVDEGIMYHPGALFSMAVLYGINDIICVGDRLQIPFLSRNDMTLSENVIMDFVNAELPPLARSYRCPPDVVAIMQGMYAPYLPEGTVLKCYNTSVGAKRSVGYMVVSPQTPYGDNLITAVFPGIPNSFDTETGEPRVRLLFYLREDMQNFLCITGHNIYRKYCSTVNQFQGCESQYIIVFRLSTADKQIYTDPCQANVAFTRHTRGLKYLTVNASGNDQLLSWIKRDVTIDDMSLHMDGSGGGIRRTYEYVDYTSIPSMEVMKGDSYFSIGIGPRYDLQFVQWHGLKDFFKLVERFAYPIRRKGNLVLGVEVLNKFEQTRLKPALRRILGNYVGIYCKTSSLAFNDTVFSVIGNNAFPHVPPLRNWYPDLELEYLVDFDNNPERVIQECIPEVASTDYIGLLQSGIASVFPSCTHVINELDAFITYTYDLDISISDVRFQDIKFVTPEKAYNCMRPVLSFTSPVVRRACLVESLIAVQKRNRNVPQLSADVSKVLMGERLFATFKKVYLDESLWEPVNYGPAELKEWLDGQKSVVANAVVGEFCIWNTDINSFEFITKGSPKPTLTDNAYMDFAAPQTIIFQTKDINAVFCVIFREIKRIIMSMMRFRKNVKIFTDIDPDSFAELLTRDIHPSTLTGKRSLEIDMSKFDKSQDLSALTLEICLMRYLCVPDILIDLWYEAHINSHVRDRLSSLRFDVKLQRRSGDAATFFGNTVFLMSVIASVFDVASMDMALFAGDDSLLVGDRSLLHNDSTDFAKLYNLDVKFFNYEFYHFCSKFLIEVEGIWYFVPDPVKLLVRLARVDLLNWTHIEEYRISLVDSTKFFCDEDISSQLSKATYERYKSIADLSQVFNTIRAVVLDESLFKTLFEEPEYDKYPETVTLPTDR
ncbi:replication-associated polyprotein [Hibiscus yellow blotch virus]|uniref:Replication-associated polyprotein n=1 Tax=Hibiscus yellow blotch virus TaxID=2809748 RepID=A0A890CS82_9VIRU|nr:replication-associated polyprotein [Hibiscus yellow blotch virus]QRG34866.1 replication-associated polyprotein [Hibiscus yellow blotch virus]